MKLQKALAVIRTSANDVNKGESILTIFKKEATRSKWRKFGQAQNKSVLQLLSATRSWKHHADKAINRKMAEEAEKSKLQLKRNTLLVEKLESVCADSGGGFANAWKNNMESLKPILKELLGEEA